LKDSKLKDMDSEKLKKIKNIIYKLLEEGNGILRLEPTWVARSGFKSGKNLGLKEEEYNKGERGEITERWIGSTTKAENQIGPVDEGLSYIYSGSSLSITLKEAVDCAKELIIGRNYSIKHRDPGMLTKILDYSDRIYYHYHQQEKDAALVGKNPKEEAYYFPEDACLGKHPETFFGVHPYIAEKENRNIILPYLVDWNSDLILKHSRAYSQARDDGFHLPSGIPHAPGSALTIEIQQNSDVYGNLQAMYMGKIMPKETLFKYVREKDWKMLREKAVLNQFDWEKSGDPYFYENRHTPPVQVKGSKQEGGEEYWIFYNTKKFSGKKLIVYPGGSYASKDNGAYVILVWKGEGKIDGQCIKANSFNQDELFVSYNKAINAIKIENNGKKDLQIFKFFGPDINLDAPVLPAYEK
jgi:mannose-6-phosphate isomerase class I